MRASALLYSVLLVACAATLSARPIFSGPVPTNAGKFTIPSAAEDHDANAHLSHAHSTAHERHNGPYAHAYTLQHSADPHGERRRPLALAEQSHPSSEEVGLHFHTPAVHAVLGSAIRRARAVEDMDLLPRRLEARKKKEHKKEPPKKAAPAKPKPAKKKHHVNWKKVGSTAATVAGDVGKFILHLFRREDPELFARLLDHDVDEELMAREDLVELLRRSGRDMILDRLD